MMYRINWRHIEAILIIFLLCLSLLLRCSDPKTQPQDKERDMVETTLDTAGTRTASASDAAQEQDSDPNLPENPAAAGQESDLNLPSDPDAPAQGFDPLLSEDPNAPVLAPTTPSITIGTQDIPLDATEADISYTDIKSLGIDMDEVFAELPNLQKITMIGCGLTNAEYADLQDRNPQIKIVWEIVLSHWIIRTDVVAFSTMKTTMDTFFMEDDEAWYLRYCTDLVALDIGHNHVSDLSFLQFMPNLKILIIVDNVAYYEPDLTAHYISDLSWLRFCPKLRYLECFANPDISDYSFLIYLPYLEDLNISYTHAYNIDYMYNLPYLQRLWMEHTYIPYEDYVTLTERYFWAQIVYFGEGSVDQGWRDPGTHHEIVRDMFANNYVAEYYQD